MYIERFDVHENRFVDKLLVSPQEAKPGNEAGNKAGKCVYSKSTVYAYEKIEITACESQNKIFVCQMELKKKS